MAWTRTTVHEYEPPHVQWDGRVASGVGMRNHMARSLYIHQVATSHMSFIQFNLINVE
jgi:hypothetical protein